MGTLGFRIETYGVIHLKIWNPHIHLDSLGLWKWSSPSCPGLAFPFHLNMMKSFLQPNMHLSMYRIFTLPSHTSCQTSNLVIYNVTWLGKCWACWRRRGVVSWRFCGTQPTRLGVVLLWGSRGRSLQHLFGPRETLDGSCECKCGRWRIFALKWSSPSLVTGKSACIMAGKFGKFGLLGMSNNTSRICFTSTF